MSDIESDPARRPLSLRLRLTLLYGTCFLVAGAAVLAITYGLVAHDTSGQERSLSLPARVVEYANGKTPTAATVTGTTPSTTTAAGTSTGAGTVAVGGTATGTAGGTATGAASGKGSTITSSGTVPLARKGGLSIASCRGLILETAGGATLKTSVTGHAPAGVKQVLPKTLKVKDKARVTQVCQQIRAGEQAQFYAVTNRGNTALRLQRRESLSSLLTWSGSALGVLAIVSILLGWLLAGRALRPIQTMTVRAQQITAESLHERLAVNVREDELGALANTFDDLLGRLERAFDSQKRFVANASHELRTPLTLERTLAEVALADPNPSVESLHKVCQRVVASTAQQERLLEALLTLARSQGTVDNYAPVDLAAAAADAIASREQRLHGIEITSKLGAATASGDPMLIDRLVANLLDNAIAHNRDSAPWIEVETGTAADSSQAWIRISNSGETIPDDAVPSLFEPFRRLSTDRTHADSTRTDGGFGLGLSIVEAIVSAHNGTVNATPVAEGGLTLEVALPAVPTAP